MQVYFAFTYVFAWRKSEESFEGTSISLPAYCSLGLVILMTCVMWFHASLCYVLARMCEMALRLDVERPPKSIYLKATYSNRVAVHAQQISGSIWAWWAVPTQIGGCSATQCLEYYNCFSALKRERHGRRDFSISRVSSPKGVKLENFDTASLENFRCSLERMREAC